MVDVIGEMDEWHNICGFLCYWTIHPYHKSYLHNVLYSINIALNFSSSFFSSSQLNEFGWNCGFLLFAWILKVFPLKFSECCFFYRWMGLIVSFLLLNPLALHLEHMYVSDWNRFYNADEHEYVHPLNSLC